jgi:tetratricopeptide (TPR) repeat protein/2-polyprenyl-3-methyl-5-hydroxy-6-metoxy-1,4-benzoquinol methylase
MASRERIVTSNDASIDDALKAGLEHHYAGRIAEAEAVYRRVRAEAPDHPDPLHLLGMIAYQRGQASAAIELIGRAIALDPSRAEFHHDLGDVLNAHGRPVEAVVSYRDALALNPANADSHFALGNALVGLRRPDDAATSYRAALALRPDYADASNNLAVLLQQQGKLTEAVAVYRAALAGAPDSADLRYNLGNAQRDLGLLDDAEASYRSALQLKPEAAIAHFNLAGVLQLKARWNDADKHYRAAIALHPSYADAHYGLGIALQRQGMLGEAIVAFSSAIACATGHVAARVALGMALAEAGRLEEAAATFRDIVAIMPDAAQAHTGLGNVLLTLGRPKEAELCHRRAIVLAPNDAHGHNNLGNALRAQGRSYAALVSYRRALSLDESSEIKATLADCLRGCRFTAADAEVRELAARALREAWLRPADLSRVACDLVAMTPGLDDCIARADAAWPSRLDADTLFGSIGLAVMSSDALLRALLVATPVCSLPLERGLTMTREALLDAAASPTSDAGLVNGLVEFHAALAAQCFINEYVFATSDEELAKARSLRDRLVAAMRRGDDVPPLWLAAIASYFPLSTIEAAASLVSDKLPAAIQALLAQQVLEPAAERRDRLLVPALTPVQDGVSRKVREQYEQNPYPRWIKLRPPEAPCAIGSYVRRQLPSARFATLAGRSGLSVLVAGCGTGQEAIETAQQLAQAHVLAIDLSVSSLCYARRKTAELGLDNIDYAQGDIMNIGTLDRTFDVVSSVGVLHHLADPSAGLAALTACLRPGGFMRLGLYSERARRDIVAARAFISERGYASWAGDIRRCRQDMIATGGDVARVASFRDFYSTSECRDLLFHVQEHRFTVNQVRELLAGAGLRFLGFVVDAAVRSAYRLRFPQDAAMTDLTAWNEFESTSPETFLGMYVFWVQKGMAHA